MTHNTCLILIILIFTSCSTVSSIFKSNSSKQEVVIEAPDLLPSPMELQGGELFESMVDKWIQYFTQNDRERFQRFLNRGEKYRSVVQAVLKENDVPHEFYYLAMIESGYVTHASSRAKAVGVWQFIRSTAKRYDLDSNYYIDERQDPIRATEAAAKYLRDLFTAFQSWDLAMAAYNAGEYRILTAIIKGKSRNFWELCDKKLLPPETRNYVPKFIAAATIGEDPEKYGFTIASNNDYPDVTAMELPSPIRLKDLANKTSIPLSLLRQTNPHLKRGVTPPYSDSYEIWIPETDEKAIKKMLPTIASLKIKGLNKKKYANHKRNYHRVRKGENLISIARKYRVSVRYLKRLNRLRSSKIYAGRNLRISTRGYHKMAKKGRRSNTYRHYKVRRGDTLSSIARRNRTSIRKLMKINRLRSSRIYPGMKLRVARRAINKKRT